MGAAACDEMELDQLKAAAIPLEQRILELIKYRNRPGHPGIIPGPDLPDMYYNCYGEGLDPSALNGKTDLHALLGRREIFSQLGVRGSEKNGGWVVYRVDDHAEELLVVQANILVLLGGPGGAVPCSAQKGIDAG